MTIDPTIQLLYVDLFCGAGGTSTGVEDAKVLPPVLHKMYLNEIKERLNARMERGTKCAKVIACVNHDANAIVSHAENHPDALHFTEDIRTLILDKLVAHVQLMRIKYPNAKLVVWASLECTNFSKAKGGLSRDPDSRTLAEHLYRYVEALNPDYIQIENVEEFLTYGPVEVVVKKTKQGLEYCPTEKEYIDKKKKIYKLVPVYKPIEELKGTYYDEWVNKIKSYNYDYDHRILNAADFGAYTSRKRYFGIFAKEGLPIVFPAPTHSKVATKSLFESLLKWKPVKDCLDFSDEGNSIFDRKTPLVENTLERVKSGLIKFVAGGKDKWLLKYNSVNGNTGKHNPPSVDEPCPTVSTQGRLGVVQTTFLSKHFSGHPESKNITIEAPAGSITTVDHHSVVNAQFLSTYYGNGGTHSLESPSPTVTTKDRLSMISPICFMDQQFGQSKAAAIDKPLGALTANPKYNLVSCHNWLMNTNFGNVGSSLEAPAPTITANRKWHYLMDAQYSRVGNSIDKPCFTLIARMDKTPPYLVEATNDTKDIPSFIKIIGDTIIYEIYETDSPKTKEIKEFMAMYGIIDIKMRMLSIPELKMIMGFPKDYVLVGTQADQKKFIGNAVEVNMARVMCEALADELLELQLQAA